MHGKRCLVLNSSWFPIGIKGVYPSITRVYSNKATVIAPVVYDGGSISYQEFSFYEWIQFKPREGRPLIRSKFLCFEAPEIIKVDYNRVRNQKLALKSENIFTRDGHKCWYCGSAKDLTIDHILAKSKGGAHSWKNLISCCFRCNNEKGDTSVEDFCKKRGCAIPVPANISAFPWIKNLGKNYPDSWKHWLHFCENQKHI